MCLAVKYFCQNAKFKPELKLFGVRIFENCTKVLPVVVPVVVL